MSEPVGVLLVAAGAGLVYAGVTGQNPVTELRKALSTGQLDGRPEPGSAPAFGSSVLAKLGAQIGDGGGYLAGTIGDKGAAGGSGSGEPSPAAGSASGAWPDDPSNLQSIGQGSHRLAAPAAAAFRAWEQAFGAKIPVTDSYRSVAQQEAAHKSNPDRYAAPGDSAHGEARAVDVDLSALGMNPKGSPSQWIGSDAKYAKLVATAKATGWCNYQVQNGTANGRTPEPWHFSFQVCK